MIIKFRSALAKKNVNLMKYIRMSQIEAPENTSVAFDEESSMRILEKVISLVKIS